MKLKQSFSLLYSIILSLMIVLTFAASTPAQTTVQTAIDQNETVTMAAWFNVNVDSNGTYVSTPFQVPSFFTASSPVVWYSFLRTSSDAKPHITTTIEGSDDGSNWVTVDTLGAVGDSTETLSDGSLDLNSNRFWYYRLKWVGLDANRDDTIVNDALKWENE